MSYSETFSYINADKCNIHIKLQDTFTISNGIVYPSKKYINSLEQTNWLWRLDYSATSGYLQLEEVLLKLTRLLKGNSRGTIRRGKRGHEKFPIKSYHLDTQQHIPYRTAV